MKKKWQDYISLFLGGWLMISPFFLERPVVDDMLFNNSLIVGLLVVLAALTAILRPNAWREWVLVTLASWLIASSYFFNTSDLESGFLSSLALNQLIVGLLIMIDGGIGLFRRQAIRDMDNTSKIR